MHKAFLATLLLALALTSGMAWALDVSETRCGISSGLVVGVGIPSDKGVHNEFDYEILIEANVKYYLFWGVSAGIDTGYLYSEGSPERVFWREEWHEFDPNGVSFWRAWPIFGTLRVELWRKGVVNPYIGGGGGVHYTVIYRKGYVENEKISNGEDEWVPVYFGTAGFDVALGKYFALRMESKYKVLQTTEEFFDGRDFGGWDVLAGFNIYF
jgi:hypothetical protein